MRRTEAAGGRRLRPLSHQERAAVLSGRRLDPGAKHPAHHALNASMRRVLGEVLINGGADQRESPLMGADATQLDTEAGRLWHSRWSLLRIRRADRGAEQPGGVTSACRTSGQRERPRNSARKAPDGAGRRGDQVNADREANRHCSPRSQFDRREVSGAGDGVSATVLAEAMGKGPRFFAYTAR